MRLGGVCLALHTSHTQHKTQLKGGEHAAYVVLLELFCYGTWPEYKGEAAARGARARRWPPLLAPPRDADARTPRFLRRADAPPPQILSLHTRTHTLPLKKRTRRACRRSATRSA